MMLIQYLLKKLKTGDSRSINLNAVPGKLATRIDISDFSEIEETRAKDFLFKLFSQSTFKVKIDLGNLDVIDQDDESNNTLFDEGIHDKISKKKRGILLKRLNTIIVSEEDAFQEHGVRSFGFGFPLLVKKISKESGEDKIMVSPVFIRKLKIERLKSSKYTYQISKDDDMAFGFNEVLLGNLEANDKIFINQISEEIIDEGVIDVEKILNNLNLILSQCGSDENFDAMPNIEKIPANKKDFDNIYAKEKGIDRPKIYWGGVFGLYRTLKEKIIEDTKKIPDIAFDIDLDKESCFDYEHSFGCVNTDPSQQSVLDNLNEKEEIIIQGPPGTGKSQTITAIITNALANNKKCLVVCEKKTALDIIKTNLSNIGLGDMCALIEDVNSARKGIVDLVRGKQEHGFGNFGFRNNNYKRILGDTNEIIDKMNTQKKLLQKDYFNNTNWKSLVGNYLKKMKNFDEETVEKIRFSISQYIDNKSHEDYSKIIKILKNGQELHKDFIETSFLKNFLNIFFTKQNSYLNCKINFDIFIKEFIEKQGILNQKINYFYEILENNKLSYTDIIEYNKEINNNYEYNKLQKGLFLRKLVSNYECVGDKKSLKLLNDFLLEYKELDFKKGEDVYTDITNVKSIKRYLLSIEGTIPDQQKFNSTIDNYQNEFLMRINLIRNIIENLEYLIENLLGKYDGVLKLGTFNNIKNSVYSIFSSKYKDISNQYNKIEKEYIELEKAVEVIGFDVIFEKIQKFNKINNLNTILDILEIIKTIISNCFIDNFSNSSLKILTFDSNIEKSRLNINDIVEDINENIGNRLKKFDIVGLGIFKDILYQSEKYNELLNKIKSDKDYLEYFYDRIIFYQNLEKDDKNIVKILKNKNTNNRVELFEIVWLKDLLLNNDVNGLPKNDFDILKLHGLVGDLKKDQIKLIKFQQKSIAESSIQQMKSKGITIQSLYNKRGSPGERRNSLRKIIATNFDLFTNIFPVVLVSPQVCSSILPLKKDLFDIVLFDEASQIRLEDVVSSMFRGKQKIICGDQHQMPPSNFFASSNILLEADDDDNDEIEEDLKFTGSDMTIQLANSESLLDYAEKKGYFQYMLKVHYRSEHPILIDFSNHAFYGGKLIALPNKVDYKPIKFYEIDGELYKGLNEKEAIFVIEILKDILSDDNIEKKYNGIIPSIGIATFNMYQRNYIWDLIQKIKYENTLPDLAEKLEQTNLFIKNLDTIQGDERDIIIISTTFAKKSDGKYTQNYGPINQSKGYRLLNVMITRAKKEVHLITSIPKDIYTKFEEKLKNSTGETKHGGSLLHAYINYCKAVHEDNEAMRLSILEKIQGTDVYIHEDEGLTESPFEEEVLNSFSQIIDSNRIKLQYQVGGFRIDMIILSKHTNKPLIAIECDGATYHSGDVAYCNDIFRQDILEGLGFIFHRIWSTNRWRDKILEEKRFKEFLEGIDELSIKDYRL